MTDPSTDQSLRRRAHAGVADTSAPVDELTSVKSVPTNDGVKDDKDAPSGVSRPVVTRTPGKSDLSEKPTIDSARSSLVCNDHRSCLPEEDRTRSLVARLWLESRLDRDVNTKTVYTLPGHDREITVVNLKLAWQLVQELWRPYGRLLTQDEGWKVGWYISRRLVKGLIPTGRVWARKKLLDAVQVSIKSKHVDWTVLLQAALVALLFTSLDDIYRFVANRADKGIEKRVGQRMTRSCLAAQLSLSDSAANSPFFSALMRDAKVYAGMAMTVTRDGAGRRHQNAFDAISRCINTWTYGVEIMSSIGLLIRTVWRKKNDASRCGRVILVLLALGPTTIRLFGHALINACRRKAVKQSGTSKKVSKRGQLLARTRMLEEMGSSSAYRHESVLYGLKDWVLGQWDSAQLEIARIEEASATWARYENVGMSLGEHTMETLFYIVLASRITGVSLSMSTIKLYQDLASSLMRCLRRFIAELKLTFQTVFYVAAFCEAVEVSQKALVHDRHGQAKDVELRDYETIRLPEGLSIEARNLSYTYPSAKTPTLHGINLNIQAGQTLALVGFNGGGKSTLVKVLMGIYDYAGELYYNGVPAKDIDPASLHRRTACLFQDFNRYELTLRENVGLGETSQMGQNKAINRAVERGGADKIMEKVGLGRVLCAWGRGQDVDAEADDAIDASNMPAAKRTEIVKPKDKVKPTDKSKSGSTTMTPRESSGVANFETQQSLPPIEVELGQNIEVASAEHDLGTQLPADCEAHRSGAGQAKDSALLDTGEAADCIRATDRHDSITHASGGEEEEAGLPITATVTANGVAPNPAPSTDQEGRARGTAGKKASKKSPSGKEKSELKPAAGLSGGQWQRVALARAFLRSDEADLVVFDEPSASLDPKAEAALFQRIHSLSNSGSGKHTATTVYISHRFSTVRKADLIAVVEQGTISEVGSHAELMTRNGRYAELFNLQKEAYDDPV